MRKPETMTRDEVWRAIDAQRVRLTDLLDDLTDDEWRHPSLCAGWTVRDVAAHLTFAQASLPEILGMVVRYRGRVNRAGHEEAVRLAARPTADLTAAIRGMVGSQRHVAVVTHRETLIDILVHSQDIAVPLGRRLDLAPDAAAFAATRVWRMGYPFWPRRRLRGFTLAATDADWRVGAGPEVRGPMEALLLLLTGRRAGLDRLDGPGAPALMTRVGAARAS